MENKRTELRSVGEFGLIEHIRRVVEIRADDSALHENLRLGIGDDAAAFRPSPGKLQLLTTDALVEGIHFDLTFTSFQHLGWKAIVSNISDIAAMQGTPRYATVVLSLPGKVSVEMVEEFYRGVAFACKKYACLVVGGDTTTTFGNMAVAVAMTGEVSEDAMVSRSGAKVGDLLCVTGHLGGAHAGLKILLREKEKFLKAGEPGSVSPNLEPYKAALERYFMPKPRLDLTRVFAEKATVHAMIDISDGLASEVHRLCEASGVGAEVWEHNLPVENTTRSVAGEFSEPVYDYALYGGEEYEMLFAIADDEFKKLERATSDVTVVGRIVGKGKGISLIRENGERETLRAGGWDHFGEIDKGKRKN